MGNPEEWPPKSPLKALLSSPSGRKKYREYQDLPPTSPSKLLGSPSLLEKLRAAKQNRDHEILQPDHHESCTDTKNDDIHRGDDDDEDEETLRLKLQAIEARLKLKKLQQQKARDVENVPPSNSTRPSTISALPSVHVPVSPTKRPIDSSAQQRSPGRVLLGIDKGLTAEDISLRRVRTQHEESARRRPITVESRLIKPVSQATKSSVAPPKSFSERMAEMRDRDKAREDKTAAVRQNRSARFNVDKHEIDVYKHKAEAHTTNYLPRNTGPTSQHGLEQENDRSRLKHARSTPMIRSRSPVKTQDSTDNNSTGETVQSEGDASLFEGFSNTHLSTRILPHSFLKRTLPEDEFTIYTIPKLLKDVHSPDYEMPDEVVNYVVFGIVCAKSAPKTHKRAVDKNSKSSSEWDKKWDDGTANNQKYIILKLTDLKWTIDLFLFDTAVPKYHRLAPGQLIAILNPGIMKPQKGREDTGNFSLAIHNGDDQVLEIGVAKHLGYCSSRLRSGGECGEWVDSRKTSICEYHLSAQLDKTRSGRSGINGMSGWGAQDTKGRQKKQGFDFGTQSHYYAVGGMAPRTKAENRWSYAPTHNPNLSTATLIDANPGNDPFIADGQMLERDKNDRLRKHMEDMQREKEITRRLAKIGNNAGREYMQHRHLESSGSERKGTDLETASSRVRIDILQDKYGESKKRSADSVRLGPVKKKTRFLTDKGIREAGRESLGSQSISAINNGATEIELDDDSE